MKLAKSLILVPLALLAGTAWLATANGDDLLGCNSRGALLEWRHGSLTVREELIQSDTCRWLDGKAVALAPDARDPQVAFATVKTAHGDGMRMWVSL